MSLPKYTTTHHTTTYPAISPLLPSLSTAGKTILITGGGSGLGTTIAHSFATSGSTRIALLGRTLSVLSIVAHALQTEFTELKVLTLEADITDDIAIDKAFASTKKEFGSIDIVVSNAGAMPETTTIADAYVGEWWKGMEVNVKGNLNLSRAFINHAPTSGGVFVHLTTAGIHLPAMPTMSSYIVSKLAAASLMAALAVENPHIRVMIMHPGILYSTPMGARGKAQGMTFPEDDVELAGNFCVWASSERASWAAGKLLWSNWDIEELEERKDKILEGNELVLGLRGWPGV